MTTSLFALAVLAATMPAGGLAAPSDLSGDTQLAKYYGYYRCVEQHPTGKRYCYKVPRVKTLDIPL